MAVPVVSAALISVPAVFFTVWGSGWLATVGVTINWTAGAVLWAEWILLFWLSKDRVAWFKQHKWTFSVAALTIPAVVFALGPAQLLRVVYLIATLRVLRVRRIISSGMAVNRYLSFKGWRRVVLVSIIAAVAAVFVAVQLFDPRSDAWLAAEYTADHVGMETAAVVAIFGGATALVYWLTSKRDG